MHKHTIYTYGIGTVGRDMLYTLVSLYLIFYLTDVIDLPTNIIWWITGIIFIARIFDVFSDLIMGLIVDNTKTKIGKFKPWIALGAAGSGIFTILLFTNFNVSDNSFIILFTLLYFLWGICFTTNDISYWSMLPTLSVDQKEREKIGSFARICANIGSFFVVSFIVPITTTLGNHLGSLQKGYFYFAIFTVCIMWAGQCVTIFFVKEKNISQKSSHTTIKEMFKVIFKNDQLLSIAISMSLFMIGYITTISFGLYFFKYIYGDEAKYSLFSIILGLSQFFALTVFPIFSKKYNRKQLFNFSIILIVIGYILFFFSPTNTMLYIIISNVFIFSAEAFIQLLMLMFLADSVDYGHWKFKKRNDSISFSIQPLIYKIGGAVSSYIVGSTIILTGIKEANSASEVTSSGRLIFKCVMMIFPLILISISYLIYKAKFKIDEKTHANIIKELREQGELKDI